jgi:hypothetical protein
MTPGLKHDTGKIRPTLVINSMALAMQAIAEVGTYGAAKYSDDNWLEVEDGIERYTDAMYRHLLDEAAGEALDDESGLMHAAHAAWNAIARLELMLRLEADSGGLPPELQKFVDSISGAFRGSP